MILINFQSKMIGYNVITIYLDLSVYIYIYICVCVLFTSYFEYSLYEYELVLW